MTNPFIAAEVILAILLTTLTRILDCQRSNIYLQCSSKEVQKAGCLNGKCYIIVLNDEREASCICESGYTGSKCQELNLEILAIAKPNIYLIVGIVILVLVVAIIICFICYRRVKGLPLSDVFSGERERELVPNDEEHHSEVNYTRVSRNQEILRVENGHTADR